ncbi:hypothetical protein BDZ94DRAFT_1253604 [Collybia nuda]|uniref:Uncharacterized protein n=1 Tax=Collybia nuda TaxID=64659 RepID=A0A9P6CGZ9_9AGAR|nr:hypothetical protein BDZ94DRAFT_1253604 [Collybia nuda]
MDPSHSLNTENTHSHVRHVAETVLDALDRCRLTLAKGKPVDKSTHPEGHSLVRAKPLSGEGGAGHPEGHSLLRAIPLGDIKEDSEGCEPGRRETHPEGHGLIRAKPIKR